MSVRVLLIYPPAALVLESADVNPDPDRLFVPHGLLTIAAELRERGFNAEILNLVAMSCEQAAETIRRRPADLVGLSCFTFHRHAAADLGKRIKAVLPHCHLTVGGPHVSAMPREWLEHYPAFDSVVVGEGEATAVELAEALRDGRTVRGIAGTACRVGGSVELAPARDRISNLDALAKPWHHFDYECVITSRGCPGRCTFCNSPEYWGRKVRFRSAENVLEELQELVVGRGHRFLAIKDDTFTAHHGRAMAICRGIVERGLEFGWVCDTRVDCLSEELLIAIRRAGCVKIHLGIESADPQVQANIRKPIDREKTLRLTSIARRLGMDVRFYLIIGCRGETAASLLANLALIEQARPTHILPGPMCIHPGTEEFTIAAAAGTIALEEFFTAPIAFNERHLGDSSVESRELVRRFHPNLGAEQQCFGYVLADREAIFANYPDILPCALDLAELYAAEGRWADAERIILEASRRIGRKSPVLTHFLACVKFGQREIGLARQLFHGLQVIAPNDTTLARNLATLGKAGPLTEASHRRLAIQIVGNLRLRWYAYLVKPDRDRTGPLPPP